MGDLRELEYSKDWTNPEDFPSLTFTKDWESQDDFPTIETDETQVRADMQYLYNEIRDYVNGPFRAYVVATGAAEDNRQGQEEQREANEAARVEAETARVSAETGREEAEDARAAAETQRQDNEATRATAETAREGAETVRQTNEETRKSNEAARVTAEGNRATAEGTRANAETERVQNETERKTSEASRASAETARANAEAQRQTNEQLRQMAENSRGFAETQRVNAEDTRKANETARVQAEPSRDNAETQRQSNEAARQNAESQRVSAENARNVWEDYDVTKVYTVGNKVAYGGSSYLCIKPCTGITPQNAEYWRLIAAKGEKGATGDAGKSAYASAQDGGYTGTEAQFNAALARTGAVATAETAGVVKIGTDFDVAEDGTLSLYKAITVTSLTCNKATVYEIGTEVSGLDFSWTLNKAPATQSISFRSLKFNNLDSSIRSTSELPDDLRAMYEAIVGNTNADSNVTLEVEDARGAKASKTLPIRFFRYAYSKVGSPGVAPTTASECVKQAALSSFETSGAEFSYAVGDCIWILTTKENARIQTNVLGQWADVNTYGGSSVTFTQANGAMASYYAYRTDIFTGAGKARYRII